MGIVERMYPREFGALKTHGVMQIPAGHGTRDAVQQWDTAPYSLLEAQDDSAQYCCTLRQDSHSHTRSPCHPFQDLVHEMQRSGAQPNAMSFNTLMRVALRDRNAITATRCIAK